MIPKSCDTWGGALVRYLVRYVAFASLISMISNRAITAVLPELVEIHRRAGVERPDYHLAGLGYTAGESIIRRSAKRWKEPAHFLFHVDYPGHISRHSENELKNAGVRYLPLHELGRFSEWQYQAQSCPVSLISSEAKISWVRMIDVADGNVIHLPAQAVLAGFSRADEPRGYVGITTGSAAHLDLQTRCHWLIIGNVTGRCNGRPLV